MLGTGNVFKACIDEALQRSLELSNVYVKFQEVPIESISRVIQQICIQLYVLVPQKKHVVLC